MAVTYVGAVTGGSPNTSYSQAYPAGTAAGDVIILLLTAYFPFYAGATMTTPSGFTLLSERINPGTNNSLGIYARVSTGETSVTLSRPGETGNDAMVATVLAYRGASFSTAASSLAAENGQGRYHSTPAITVANAGVLVRAAVTGDAGSPRGYASGFPGGTQRVLTPTNTNPQAGGSWTAGFAVSDYPTAAGQAWGTASADYSLTEDYAAAAIALTEVITTPYVPAVML